MKRLHVRQAKRGRVNGTDRRGNRKLCVAEEGREGGKCSKKSDSPLEGYAYRREAEALQKEADGDEIELAQCHPPYTNQ